QPCPAHNRANYHRSAADYQRTPVKPCLDGEPGYEGHPAGFKKENGYLTDYDARKAAYWALLAGAHGHTYGCHDVWQFWQPGRTPITHARTPWREAIQLPGAGQMQFARRLLESRPFLSRIPDRSLIASDPGKGTDHIQATRDESGSYALIYTASGKSVTVDLSKLSGTQVRAHWYDPRRGTALLIGQMGRDGKREFKPPSAGKGHDWVLVLDEMAKNFPAPGQAGR